MTKFTDITTHWAKSYIEALAARRIFNGYPDGTFRPDNSLTRGELAAILSVVFNLPVKRQYIPFTDIPDNYWGKNAVKKAYEMGFLVGYPNKTFQPQETIFKGDLLVALVNGLDVASKINPDLANKLADIYQDASLIPYYGVNQIAIATRAGLVVNYPNPKILNYKTPATRADVAAIIYQTLVYLGQSPAISNNYLVVPPTVSNVLPDATTNISKNPPTNTIKTVKVNHRREFRGVWLAPVWNLDWPSKSGLSVETQKQELLNIIKKLQSLNFNALILQVRPESDALYASALEPWSAWITGKQGKAPQPFYDPLEFAIAECHKRNIEVHAWFNPYRGKTNINEGVNVSPHIAITNPEVAYQWGNQLWMDPGSKIVQDRVYNVIIDVTYRYDIDGIHLDDYFYPYPMSGKDFPDHKTYASYQKTGGKLSLADWRRENVNQMVLRISQGIKQIKPYVKFGISPFGIYRSGEPKGIVGLDAYNVLYADSKKWLQEGWIDYISPQLYWRTDQPKQSYEVLLKWWTEVNTKKRHIYVGNNVEALDGKAWKSSEIGKQITISRNLVNNLSLGNIFFSLKSIIDNRESIADQLQSIYYSQPAIIPTTSWINSQNLPVPPKDVKFVDGKINWQPGNNQPVRSWTLYRQNGDSWVIQRILSAGTTFATVQPGTYAICAVDRLGNESLGVIIVNG